MKPYELKGQELMTECRTFLAIPGAPLGEHKDAIAKTFAVKICQERLKEAVLQPNDIFENRHAFWNDVIQFIETNY